MISLRRRFTLWSLGAAALLAVMAGISLYLYVRSALYRQFDQGLRARAELIGSVLRVENDGQYEMDFSDESMPEYLPGHRPEYFQVISPDHTTLDRSASLKGKNLVPPASGLRTVRPWDMVLPDGRPGRAFAMLAMPHEDADDHDRPDRQSAPVTNINLPPAEVIVAQDRLQMDHALDALLSALLLSAAILAAGSIVVVRFVVEQALKPIDQLARQAQDVGPANLNYRFDIAVLPQELQLICQRLNELLERLDQAFTRERRLNADIAHELRTPIAELRTLTEVARRWPMDASQSAVYFNDAHAIALKMGSMIDTLLNLARARAHVAPNQDENIALASLIERSLCSLREKIDRRRLRVSMAPAACCILTDRLIFTRIIDNILSNAVSYAAPGGRIDCRIQRRGNECWLTIANSNDSLHVDDIPRIFEPFWRKDLARSDSEHTGLGLTLVVEYARQLGIAVSAHLPSPAWFEMVLKIPNCLPAESEPIQQRDSDVPSLSHA